MPSSNAEGVVLKASQARQSGRPADALSLLAPLVESQPGFAPAWNLLGLIQMDQGRPDQAAGSFQHAVQADRAPPLWVNLSRAHHALGDHASELKCLEEALALDPYYLPAILGKGRALRLLGHEADAVQLYRLLLDGLGDTARLPSQVNKELEEVRAFLRTQGEQRLQQLSGKLQAVASEYPKADLSRVSAYAQHMAGTRRVYQQQPTGPHFPFLPAIEFFDRKLFPWFDRLEQHTDAMREELLSLWAADDPAFRPYVSYPPGTPVNQWADLNHSPRWSAWFFWENGVRNDAACERCPRTAAAIEQAPMLDMPGKGPTAMFSVLKPRTRIPAHTGTSNVRVTVHLPLVVPPGCGFRVGAETREWREGEAWAFDDTIEHEAWNDSDSPRAILIIDTWNPLLTEAERAAVRELG